MRVVSICLYFLLLGVVAASIINLARGMDCYRFEENQTRDSVCYRDACEKRDDISIQGHLAVVYLLVHKYLYQKMRLLNSDMLMFRILSHTISLFGLPLRRNPRHQSYSPHLHNHPLTAHPFPNFINTLFRRKDTPQTVHILRPAAQNQRPFYTPILHFHCQKTYSQNHNTTKGNIALVTFLSPTLPRNTTPRYTLIYLTWTATPAAAHSR